MGCIYALIVCGVYIHISVDSNVVCSTMIGSARASKSGTDSIVFHAFYMYIIKD